MNVFLIIKYIQYIWQFPADCDFPRQQNSRYLKKIKSLFAKHLSVTLNVGKLK